MPQLPQIDSVKAPDKIMAQATRTRQFPWLNLPFILVIACWCQPQARHP